MSFEKTVLDRVARVLKTSQQAAFTSGTLFVECDERDSRRVLRALNKEVNSSIIVSGPIQGEYAYDFV